MVSQRLFDEVCKRYDDQIKQLRDDVAALEKQRNDDKQAEATARTGSRGLRIAAVGAGAAVVAAWIGLVELWNSLRR
jgi:hypothetical protein